ncbi:hypothetical protein ACGFNU_21260 [Spirillospora sp. NPDC048911]|uniref:Gp37-like protein n=1 Tax=Spirillospora sp. NPDC048911 TaxID=3364527 RepID=UPI00371F6173
MTVSVESLDLTTFQRGRPVVFDKVDVTIAHNHVGSFTLEMPADARNWELIQLDGNGDLLPVGILVNWNGVYEVPLVAEDWDRKETLTDGRAVETLTLIGADMLSVLANRVAYPNPAATWASQTVTTTTYTGAAETVIKTIVAANLVTAADTDRRVPLTIAADLARGGSVTYKVVPPDPAATTGTQTTTVQQSLMDMARAIDLQSPIGVQIALGASGPVFDVYLPRDLTEQAVFSKSLGNLPESSLSVTAPTGNAVLLQSKVTGTTFTQANGNGYNNPWRRVEVYSDQSSVDTAADVTTAGNEALASGAGQVKISVTVVDLPNLRFGDDDLDAGIQGYLVGDKVTLDVRDGVTYSDVVTKAQLVADATGDTYTETVTPTIGVGDDATDQTISAKLSARLRAVERALRGSVTA